MNNLFLLQTFIHLAFQLGLTGLTVDRVETPGPVRILLMIIMNIALTFLMYMQSIPLPIRFVMFCLFSIFNGYIVSMYTENVDREVIRNAIVETLAIFMMMVGVGIVFNQMGVDISPLIMLAFMYSIAMIAVLLYQLFFRVSKTERNYVRLAMIGLMMLYIVVHTYMNMSEDYENDIVISTLNYYTDILSIFKNLVRYSEE